MIVETVIVRGEKWGRVVCVECGDSLGWVIWDGHTSWSCGKHNGGLVVAV